MKGLGVNLNDKPAPQPKNEPQGKKEEPLQDKKKQKGKSPEKGKFSGIATDSGYIYTYKNGSNPKR